VAEGETEMKKHGHPFFYEQTRQEEDLHSKKNHDYAAGGDPLGNFTRVAAILGLYPGLDPSDPAVVAEIYALKQLDACLWGLAKGIKHQVEGFHERLQDRSVYAKIERCILKDRERVRSGGLTNCTDPTLRLLGGPVEHPVFVGPRF
jgi:hypothetical protein